MKPSVLYHKTRGLINNNPANIRRSSSHWLGLLPVQRDREFCQFSHIRFGIRAFIILCKTYRRKYGVVTIPQFLNRFAPLSENDTLAYIKYCLKYCGFEVFHNDEDYAVFACAIFWYESKFTCTDSYVLDVMSQFRLKVM